ncbi:hypothetical protein J3459_009800 [Metarhizium acridum]|nr:hypothetical protein J3459_009800 [Metarhizium acridum]
MARVGTRRPTHQGTQRLAPQWASRRGRSTANVSIRLYYGSPGNVIKEKAWDHGKGWYDGDFSQGSVPASHVAATPKPTLRVYIQNGTKYTAVTEFAWEGRGMIGQQALPPA